MHIMISLIKWLFTLHQLVWFVAGGLSCTAMTYFYMKLKYNEKFTKGVYSLVVLSSLTSAFAILWTYDSYIENEIQAANMGALLFGGTAIVFGILAYKLASKKSVKPASAKE